MRLDKAVILYTRNAARYEAIQNDRINGIPSVIIFGIHGRESDWDFSTNLANGDSLQHRTINVPVGRIPGINPPYSFEQAAIDALYAVDEMDQKEWHKLNAALTSIEYYNGSGYRKYHPDVPSPYLWSSTTIYTRGKYSADGKFDPLLVDKQLGIAAVLKQMAVRGISLPFPEN